MFKKILILLLLLPIYSFGQIKYSLDNSLTGLYGTTKVGQQFSLSINGSNSLDYKKFGFDFNPSYNVLYSPELTQNEYLSRQNLRYGNDKHDFFITNTYNHSMIRGINYDNFIGIGGGIKRKFNTKLRVSLSYAILYQNTEYSNKLKQEYFRHSLRSRFKLDLNKIQISTEYYFQPRFDSISNLIIYGNTQLILFPKNKVNLTLQDNINYRVGSTPVMLHNVTMGVKMKISK